MLNTVDLRCPTEPEALLFSARLHVNELIEGLFFKPVFHYTSPNGLMGILQSGNFHFTKYNLLSDFSEGKDIVHIFKEIIRGYKNNNELEEGFFEILKNADTYLTKWDPDFRREIHVFTEKDQPHRKKNIRCTPYLCCFSLNPDSIPMWSYYVKGEKYEGFNIGVSSLRALLPSKENGYDITLHNVIYEDDKKRELLKKGIDELYNTLYKKVSESAITFLVIEILNTFRLVFKKETFSHEEEVRAILWIPDEPQVYWRKFEVKFRSKGALIIPYVEHEYEKNNIETIMIGPVLDKGSAQEGVKALIDSCGLSDVDIEHSNAPLRY